MPIITVQGASSGSHVVVTVDGAGSGTLAGLVSSFSNTLTSGIAGGSISGQNLTPGSTEFASNTSGYGVITAAGSYQVSGDVGAIVFGGLPGTNQIPSAHVQIDASKGTASFVSVEGGTTQGVQFQAGSSNGVFVAGTGNNSFLGDQLAGGGNWSIYAGSGNDTVIAGTGNSTINAGTGNNYISVSQGTNVVNSYGQDTIFGGDCNPDQTVNLYGGSSFVTVGKDSQVSDLSGGNNAITVGGGSTVRGGANDSINLNGGSSTILGGSSDTISASGDALIANSDIANVSVSGSLTFIGGTGQSTITAASSTIFGASGLDAIVNATSNSTESLFVANAGNETLDGSNSVYGIHAFGNVVGTSGTQTFIGGTGTDTLVAGVGDATMTGGSGAMNYFAFRDGIAGGNYTITDFGSAAGNVVGLLHYTQSDLTNALNSATTSGNNTTIKLSDNTTITFDNVTSLNSGDFQIW